MYAKENIYECNIDLGRALIDNIVFNVQHGDHGKDEGSLYRQRSYCSMFLLILPLSLNLLHLDRSWYRINKFGIKKMTNTFFDVGLVSRDCGGQLINIDICLECYTLLHHLS